MGFYADPKNIKTGDLVRVPYVQQNRWNVWNQSTHEGSTPVPAIDMWKRGYPSRTVHSEHSHGIVISVVKNDVANLITLATKFPYDVYEWAVWVLLGDQIILTSLAYIATCDEDEPF